MSQMQLSKKINQLGWESLIHPPYSLDCAPSDYHLFASLSHSLAGKNFVNLAYIENHLKLYFASKSPEFYARGIDLLPKNDSLLLNIMVHILKIDYIFIVF